MIKLKDITWDNFWAVIKVEPKDNQKPYVKPVSVFMAQSYINLKESYEDVSYALYDDDLLVGFTKLVFVPKNVKPYHLKEDAYMIDALIIDQSHQGKGYANDALTKIIEYCSAYPFAHARDIVLVCHVDNNSAQQLFTKFKFKDIASPHTSKNMRLFRYQL